MEETNEEVKKLAESLRKSGLAASDLDALNKAKNILGYSNKGESIRVHKEESVETRPEDITPNEEPPKPITEPEDITPVERPPKEPIKTTNNNFNDPTFNIAQSKMNLNELKEGTSNKPIQKQENPNVIKTNEEIENTTQEHSNIKQSKESVKEEKEEKIDLSKIFNFGNR